MSILSRFSFLIPIALLATACGNSPEPCTNGGARVGNRCVYRCAHSAFCEADGAAADVMLDATGLDIASLDTGNAVDDVAPADVANEETSACTAPRVTCAGACVDTATDAANCGACGRVCSSANGTPSCVGGQCHIACASGFADCDGDASNGCEVELATSVDHCGTCGTRCSGASNATAACVAGVCRINCAAGYADCNMMTSDGCETGTDSNVMNCGGCGVVCPGPLANAETTCVAGVCGLSCINPPEMYWSRWADCDGELANGCETNIFTDAHCGERCGYGPCPTNSYCDQGACCQDPMFGSGCLPRP